MRPNHRGEEGAEVFQEQGATAMEADRASLYVNGGSVRMRGMGRGSHLPPLPPVVFGGVGEVFYGGVAEGKRVVQPPYPPNISDLTPIISASQTILTRHRGSDNQTVFGLAKFRQKSDHHKSAVDT